MISFFFPFQFDLQYTVKSAYTYLHTTLTNSNKTKVFEAENTPEENLALFDKLGKNMEQAREILAKLVSQHSALLNIAAPAQQANEIQGDPSQFRKFVSSKPAGSGERPLPQKPTGSLVQVARDGNLGAVQQVVKAGAKIDQEDNTGQTALEAAISRGRTDVALYLITHGANVNHVLKGSSVLHLACEGTCGAEVVGALLQKSAKVNEKNLKLETPLHVAARFLRCDIIKLLIERKANLFAKDNVGRLPLQVLALKGDFNPSISAPPQQPMGIELARFLDSGEFSDVTFVVEGERFKTHKLVICAQCPPFRSMLENNSLWKEQKATEVPLEDIAKNVFRHFLRWIYTNDASFPQDDIALVLELLALADKYLITNLQRKCEHILSTKISIDTVLPIYSYAKVVSPTSLGKACSRFVLHEFEKLRELEGIMEVLNEIVESDKK